jgi:malate dehydrogenase
MQVTALDQRASPDVKVVVIANPANTNCLAALKLSTRIPAQNFSCLTRLDHERLKAGIVAKFNTDHPDKKVGPEDIKDVCIFGNHSTTQVPYATRAQIRIGETWEPLVKYISEEWMRENLIGKIQVRGGEILKAQQASSGMSAAIAISRHLKDWLGFVPASPADEVFSMGILSDGNPYGVPPGLIFSFPVRRVPDAPPGTVEIVAGFPIGKEYQDLLNLTTSELQGEWADAEAHSAALS